MRPPSGNMMKSKKRFLKVGISWIGPAVRCGDGVAVVATVVVATEPPIRCAARITTN